MDIDTVFIAAETANEIIKLAETKNIRGENAFLCASFETILATKLHAIKYNNECREGKDVTDIKMLVKANNIDVSSEWFKTLCIKYSDEEIYNNIFKNKGKD
jgi:Nucleotidyl transferase AbiEii toxin, Type IV TA system